MHAFELATLTSTLAGYGRVWLASEWSPSDRILQAYWLATRCRHEGWSRRMAAHRRELQGRGISYRVQLWHEIMPVLQEILLSEPLTRWLAYLGHVLPAGASRDEVKGLTRSALDSHIEARHRCLHLMVFGQGLSVEDAVKLNRLRRGIEEFTDQLLATLPTCEGLEPFCFDEATVVAGQRQFPTGQLSAWQLAMHTAAHGESLRQKLLGDLDQRAPSARHNLQISQAVLRLLPSHMFDSWGVPKSERHQSIEASSAEATGQCHDLSSPLMHPLNILFAGQRQVPSASRTKPRWS